MSSRLISFLPDMVVYGVFGALIFCFCGITFYYLFRRFFVLERRAIIDAKRHMKVEVLIVEKVVEEEKFDPGPPRELTRRELKKQREREREKTATAGTAGSGSPTRQLEDSHDTKTLKDEEGKSGWISWFIGNRKDTKIAGEQSFVALNSASTDTLSMTMTDIELDKSGISAEELEEERKQKQKAERKERKEEKKRAALAALQEEETLKLTEKVGEGSGGRKRLRVRQSPPG